MKQHITLFTVLTLFLPFAQTPAQQNTRGGHTSTVNAVALSDARVGHTDKVNAIALSPDGKLLASASMDETVKIWDIATGKELLTITSPVKDSSGKPTGENSVVYSLAFRPDGKSLAAGSNHGILLFNPVTGKQTGAVDVDYKYPYSSIEYSRNGELLAAGCDPSQSGKQLLPTTDGSIGCMWDAAVVVWNATSHKELHRLKGAFSPIAFNPTGTLLATSGVDPWVRVWNTRTGVSTMSVKRPVSFFNMVHALSFNGTGTILAAATSISKKEFSGIYEILRWNSMNGSIVATPPITSGGHFGRYLQDGESIIVHDPFMLSDNKFKVLDAHTGKEISSFGGRRVYENLCAISSNERIFATTGYGNRVIRIFDLVQKSEVRAIEGHSISVTSIAFTADSKKLAAGYDDSRLIWWDVKSGRRENVVTATSDGEPVFDVFPPMTTYVSPDSKVFIHSGRSQIFDAETGERIFWGDFDLASYVFDPKGSTLIRLSKETITFLDAANGKPVNRLLNPLKWSTAARLAASYDGKLIAISDDLSISLLESSTGKKIKQISANGLNDPLFGFAPDGKHFIYAASPSGKKITVVDVASEKEVFSIGETLPHFAVSSDSSRIASVAIDGRLVISTLADREAAPIFSDARVRGLAKWVTAFSWIPSDLSISFSPDSSKVAVGGPKGIMLFDAKTARLIHNLI